VRAAVLTVSDGVSEGTREDRSGDALEELLAGEGFGVERRVVPDDRGAIADAIVGLAETARVVLTTGGTGLGPRVCYGRHICLSFAVMGRRFCVRGKKATP
jgi:molybdopterin biosynthesis enzyme MoaB